MVRLDGARILAWRLRRHALEPVAGTSVADVADRVVALRAWPQNAAELAIAVRQSQPRQGALERALESGEVMRSYAFRGGSYVFTPAVAADLLRLRGTTRVWETSRYQRQGGFELDDWEPLRDAICDILADGPKTRQEIGAQLARIPALGDLSTGASGAGADSLYKPLHWWGDISFGPERGGQSTFRLVRGDPGWPGLPDLNAAAHRAIAHYLAAYGPATLENLNYWFCEGLSVPRSRLFAWLEELGTLVTVVEIEGFDAFVLTADLDEIDATKPTGVVRLLPGYDPWVLGPGTADTRILAPDRRAVASRGANLVIRGGLVTGAWRPRERIVTVSWFDEAGPPPGTLLEADLQRLSAFSGHELDLTVQRA